MIANKLRFKKKWSDRGVSEIIGTILMLVITVVLFSTIMVGVMGMPAPQKRPAADFIATLTYKTATTAYLNISHNGGEPLYSYSAKILVVRNTTNNVMYTFSDGALGSTWSIGQKWSKLIWAQSTTVVEVRIVDFDSNTMVWQSVISGGQTSSYPMILQRWVDANTSTITLDPIRASSTTGFTFYVRATDADNDLPAAGVWVDASSVGLSSSKAYARYSGGLWEFDFTAIGSANISSYDGKPLFIHARDSLNHETVESYILSVLQPDVVVNNDNRQTFTTETPVGDEGMPSYILYVHGDQGYVVLGENKTSPRTWGALAKTSDPRFNFTQGEGWIFIRVGTKLVKNLDAINSMKIRSIFSTDNVTPPSSTSAFSLQTVSGTVYIYQAKFNSSLLAPGAYSVIIDLQSSATEGQSPGKFYADFQLYIDPASGQSSVFTPKLLIYKEDRRVNPSAQQWGNKTTSFDLTSLSTSIIWIEISMQDVGAASTASVQEVRIADMRGRSNLNGDPPTGDNMISSISADSTRITYYFSVDLRLKNGVSYTAGLSAYNLKVTKIFDANEGIYTLTKPVWIKSAIETKNFIVGTSGFGFGKLVGADNFIHTDSLMQFDNNKFFTSRVLASNDGDPGTAAANYYRTIYFDVDEDGDRDVLAAFTENGNNRLAFFINRLNEYGIWEPRSVFSNYTDTGNSILSMASGDVDGDGDQDWVVSQSAGKVYLYQNDFPIITKTLFTGMYFQEMRLVDINNDGRADLVGIGYSSSVARGAANSKLYGYNLTRGTSITANPVVLINGVDNYIYDFDVGDIDGAGGPDIALATAASSTHGVCWYQWSNTWSYYFATADPGTYTGTRVSGTYSTTQTKDGSSEQIQENGGRVNYTWPVGTIAGTTVQPTLLITAKVSSGSSEGFYFYYSKSSSGPFTFMFVVPASASTSYVDYSFPLPAGTSGTIYVRVMDSSQGSGDTTQDTVYVDLIKISTIGSISYAYRALNTSETTFTCIGIGDADNSPYRDVYIGKSMQVNVLKIKSDGNLSSDKSLTSGIFANIRPDGNMFEIKDVNGDGLADIFTRATSPASAAVLGGIYVFINLGTGITYNTLLICDLYASFGNKGDQTVNCLNSENMYG